VSDVFAGARKVIEDAIAARVFPGASLEVGGSTDVLWRAAHGRLTYERDADPVRDETLFDLASLTKVISTASLAMQAVERGALDLDEPVRVRVAAWAGRDREHVAMRDLLAHASGLTAWLPFYRDHAGRVEFERAICSLPLEYEPRSRSIYSDLGFMLLGFAIEDLGGAPLDAQFDAMRAAIPGAETLMFRPPPSARARTAPTEIDPWRGRLIVGEVHDENTWALGGVAGQAGLFGTARAVGAFARAMLDAVIGRANPLASPANACAFVRRTDIPGSSRALGWDTMLPTSSCGTRMSASAFGHTGFTGTSLWIDPERDLYVVLLTNRVHPTRANDRIQSIRRAFHDAVVGALAPRATH
jgi:CubicO group peptidase (beta-lactamase class C family)